MAIVQELSERYFNSRMNACELLLDVIPKGCYCFFFSDEDHFHLCGSVNKRNMRYLADTNPQKLHERPLHFPKVTVCCAISSDGIIGPWFFEDSEFGPVCKHATNFFIPTARRVGCGHTLSRATF